jgi:hypothetical protein
MRRNQIKSDSRVVNLVAGFLRAGIRREAACFVLVINLLIWPGGWARGPLESAVNVADSAIQNLSLVVRDTLYEAGNLHMGGLPSLFRRGQTQQTMDDRTAAVQKLRMSPSHYVGYERQIHSFSALPSNSILAESPAHGAKLTWQSSDSTVATVDESGKVTMLRSGLVWIICRAGTVEVSVPLLVKPGPRPIQTFAQWVADQNSLSDGGVVTGSFGSGGMGVLDSLLDKPASAAQSAAD